MQGLRDLLRSLSAGADLKRILVDPSDLAWLRLGRRRTLVFRDGLRLDCRPEEYSRAVSLVRLALAGAHLGMGNSEALTWRVAWEEGWLVTPDGIRFHIDSISPLIFAETFVYDAHFIDFDLSRKVIVDAGAFVGDTALYFARRGAEVVAIEPDPSSYSHLVRNLDLNPDLRARIHPHNSAVGLDGMAHFAVGAHGESRLVTARHDAIQVPSRSLRTLLSEHRFERAAVLKCDVRGAEFDLVQQPEIARFASLRIEYHADLRGSTVLPLMESVRARGFDHVRIYNFGGYPLMVHGNLHAERASAVVD